MISPFDAPRSKLERAKKHLSDYEEAEREFFGRKPCKIVVEDFFGQSVPGSAAFIARIKDPVPNSLSMIIGDLIHNLRTALDLMACDLVRLAGRNPSYVYFPFCESPDDLKDAIRKRNIHKAGEDVVRLVESMQPYKNGNLLLRAIHDLDVYDKHKTVLLTIAAASFPLSDFLGRSIETPSGDGRWNTILVDGSMVLGLPASMSPPLGTEMPSRFFLCFEDGYPFIKGRPVLEFLHHATKLVDGVIESFASLRPNAIFPPPNTF